MYFIGSSTIYLFVFLSIERYLILSNSKNFYTKNTKKACVRILICVLIGFACSIAPVLGWSHYTLEATAVSCSVEMNEYTTNVISYKIFMFSIVFFIPLTSLIVVNIKIILLVSTRVYLFFL